MLVHTANSRGKADHGWLQSHHTFSFADYYNPERMNFGVLRVINDDVIAAGTGFGKHPHRDMEIITIPIEGSLIHEDSEGNHGIIGHGEVQVMSAGTGIFHSEFSDPKVITKLLQIWVLPKKNQVKPRYDQKKFPLEERLNNFQLLVSPDGREGSLAINQDAFFSMVHLTGDKTLNYTPKLSSNGAYVFVVRGNVVIDGKSYSTKDAVGYETFEQISMESKGDGEILIMEVPME